MKRILFPERLGTAPWLTRGLACALTFLLAILLGVFAVAEGQPTLTTDKPDYSPGEIALLSGAGFEPNESVFVVVTIDDPVTGDPLYRYDWTYESADAAGTFQTAFTIPWEAANMPLTATATGLNSGLVASCKFTDSVTLLEIQSPTTSSPITVTSLPSTVTVRFQYGTNQQGPENFGGSVTIKTPEPTTVVFGGLQKRTNGEANVTLLLPAGTPNGRYDVEVTLNHQSSATKTQEDAVIVDAKTPTAISNVSGSGVYGSTGTLTGTLKAGDTSLASRNISFTVNGKNVGTAATNISGVATLSNVNLAEYNAGNHAVVAAFNGDATYASSSGSGTMVIDRATPVITWANPADIVYGTALGAVQQNAAADVPGTFTYTPAAGTVLGAGTHTLEAKFTPTDTANYNTPDPKTVQIIVNKAPATLTFGNLTQTYDGTPKSVSVTTDPANLQAVTVTYAGQAAAPTNAGSYAARATLNNPNYEGSATGTLVINKATPVITWAKPADIVYGTPLDETQLNAKANVAGAFTYTPAAGTVLGAGKHTLKADFTPTDTDNYNSATATVEITVLKATPVITWANPADIVYGTPLGETQLNAKTNVPGTFAYDPAAGTVLSAGTHTLKVDFTPTDAANYNGASGSVPITVKKAALSVVVADKTKVYLEPLPELTGTLTGVVNNDGITASYSTTATPTSNAGTYPITATLNDPNQKLNNYDVTNTAGTLTITKAPATVTFGNLTQTYDGTPKPVSITTNPAGLEKVTVTYAGQETAPTNAGSYAVEATLDNLNYQAPKATGTLEIKKGSQVINWPTPAPISQGTALSAGQLNATVTTGDGALTYSPPVGTVLAVGTHTLRVEAAETLNYKPASKEVSISVTNVAPTVRINSILTGQSGYVTPITGDVRLQGRLSDPGAAGTLGPEITSIKWCFSTIGGAVALEVLQPPHQGTLTQADLDGWKIDTTVTFQQLNLPPGVYSVTLVVEDRYQGIGSANTIFGTGEPAFVVVYDPTAGHVTGGGWINSPAGALRSNPAAYGKASFGFVARYQKGRITPDGNTQFQFQAGNLNFQSTSYDWLVINGNRAQYRGVGTIAGAPGQFRFTLTAVDGDSGTVKKPDQFRIKIVDAADCVVYDNQFETADDAGLVEPGTYLGGGSIVIHTK